MKIGVSLNEVLRDFLGQFIYIYEKYIGPTEINVENINDLDLKKFFNFTSDIELKKFLYNEASLEIFGHADQISDGLMNHFNTFLMDVKDETGHEIEIVSVEADKSISATFFFLSKTGCRANKIRFVQNSINEWDEVDILITANPQSLKDKPTNKISVKVKSPYNTNIQSDYEIDSILDIIKDESFRNKILNTKITTYQEL